jgi:hypothetical protein
LKFNFPFSVLEFSPQLSLTLEFSPQLSLTWKNFRLTV